LYYGGFLILNSEEGNIFKVVFVIIGTIIGAGFASRSGNIFVF